MTTFKENITLVQHSFNIPTCCYSNPSFQKMVPMLFQLEAAADSGSSVHHPSETPPTLLRNEENELRTTSTYVMQRTPLLLRFSSVNTVYLYGCTQTQTYVLELKFATMDTNHLLYWYVLHLSSPFAYRTKLTWRMSCLETYSSTHMKYKYRCQGQ